MALKYCEPCCFLNKNNPAKFFCLECQEVYCDNCETDHSKFRVLRRHNISRISENIEDDLVEYKDQEARSKTENVYVPERRSFEKRDFESKLDGNGSLTRCDLGMSADEYMNSETKSQQHVYDYILSDIETSSTVKNMGSLNKTEEPIYSNVSSDLVDFMEREPVGIGGKVKKTGDSIRPEECVLHEYSVAVEKTDLAKLIGVQNKKCSFRIYSAKIALLADSNVYFEAMFTVIRRYDNTKKIVSIEFGRRCEYGQGQLVLKSPKPQKIFDALKKQIEHVQQNNKRFN